MYTYGDDSPLGERVSRSAMSRQAAKERLPELLRLYHARSLVLDDNGRIRLVNDLIYEALRQVFRGRWGYHLNRIRCDIEPTQDREVLIGQLYYACGLRMPVETLVLLNQLWCLDQRAMQLV